MLSLGSTLISDLAVASLFKHSLSGMILLYLAVSVFTQNVFLHKYITPGRPKVYKHQHYSNCNTCASVQVKLIDN